MSDLTKTPTAAALPTWETVRVSLAAVQNIGRTYLVGQVWLGWQLASLKEAHGANHGGNRRSSGQDVHLKSWATIVEAETGLQRRTADRLIGLFDAAKAKLKRVHGPLITNSALAAFRDDTPLTIQADLNSELQIIIASLCDGETQKSLLHELGVTPYPKAMPTGTRKSLAGDSEQPTAGQLAFHFFDGVAAPLVNARCNPEYKKLLLALPVHSTTEHPLSLCSLEAEFRAILADIEEAQQIATKPTRGKVIK